MKSDPGAITGAANLGPLGTYHPPRFPPPKIPPTHTNFRRGCRQRRPWNRRWARPCPGISGSILGYYWRRGRRRRELWVCGRSVRTVWVYGLFAEWNDGADEREGGGACASYYTIDTTRGNAVRILLLKESWIWTLGSDAGMCIRNVRFAQS